MAEAPPECDASLSTIAVDFVDTDYCKLFLKRMFHLREQGDYTDVVLKTDELEVACHKVVLSAASDYFQAMFSSGSNTSPSYTILQDA